MTKGFSHHYHLGESISVLRGIKCDFQISFIFLDENSLSKQNSPRWDATFYLLMPGKNELSKEIKITLFVAWNLIHLFYLIA